MRITTILLFCALMHAGATGFSQKVTIAANNTPLAEVFKNIEHQTGLVFVTYDHFLDHAGPVNMNVRDIPVDQALTEIAKSAHFTFKIVQTTIFIKANPPSYTENVLTPPTSDIHGRVLNDKGEPLAGASIQIKGAKQGTQTDQNGYYELKHVPSDAIINVTFTGYSKKEVKVAGQTFLEITLIIAQNPLDEVQVVAYGTTTQRYNTGDVVTVSSKEIEKSPVSNPLSAIEGRVSGLFITQNSGVPGAAFNMQLRGQTSIYNGNLPFIVIDGVPYTSLLLPNLGKNALQGTADNPAVGGSPLSFLSPADIETISILKDADATAIFGSRGANGAIIITTKKGRSGPTKITANYYSGIGSSQSGIKWLNTTQYLQMRHEAFSNDGVAPDPQYDPDVNGVWDSTKYTNWQKLLTGGTAHFNDAQALISGGNNNTQFAFGTDYHSETSVFPIDTRDHRESFHLNLTNTSLNQRLKINVSATYLVDDSKLPSVDLTLFESTPPDAPAPLNNDGSLNWAGSLWPGGNPLAPSKQLYISHTDNLIANTLLNYHLSKALDAICNFGYTNMRINETTTVPIVSQDPSFSPTGSSAFTSNQIRSWLIEPQITFHITKSNYKLEALAGTTFQQNNSQGQILAASGYLSDALLTNPQAAPKLSIQSQTIAQYNYNALFGRVRFNYRDKYLITGNVRMDGSSRFGPSNQFHTFASLGAGWIFTEERFLSTKKHSLSFGKLQVSYGTTGQDQIGDYRFYNLFTTSQYPYQNVIGLTPSTLYNPNLQWEQTKKIEGSIDLGFFNDRLLLKSSYYVNRSSNQLLPYLLPTLTGFSSVQVNFPATIENNGFEFQLNSTNVNGSKFSWITTFNITVPRNKLVSFPNIAKSPYASVLAIGQPITVNRVFHFIGVNDTTGIYQFADQKGNPTYNPAFGTDNTAFVSTAPKYYGGLINTFQYRNLELEIFLQFTKQLGPNVLFQQSNQPGSFYTSNEPTLVLSRWQKPGDKTQVEQFSQGYGAATTGYYNAQSSDYAYTDASYIRVKNVSLTYSLTSEMIQKLHLSECKVFLRAENLFTITSYKGQDPESQSLNALPPMRVITAGIHISL